MKRARNSPTREKSDAEEPVAKKRAPAGATSTPGDWDTVTSSSGTVDLLALNAAPVRKLAKPGLQVAGFDMDWTLVKPKSGAAHPKDEHDWQWLYPNVVKVLDSLLKGGNAVSARPFDAIVIVSNQAGISKGRVDAKQIQKKMELLRAALSPATQEKSCWLISAAESRFRKPCTGALDWLLGTDNCHKLHKESFFCGDAAGRPKTKTRKRDFSDGDLKFALNLGVPFKLPEQLFEENQKKQEAAVREVPGESSFEFHPAKTLAAHQAGSPSPLGTQIKASLLTQSGKKELILMVACPGSGKSTFAKDYILNASPNYVHVNQDTLKTPAKCQAATEAAFRAGQSVVVDNQNKEKAKRADYIKLAKLHKVDRVRAILFDVPKAFCFHMNTARARIPGVNREKVPDMVIHSFFKYLEKPVADKDGGKEGIDEVLNFTLKDFRLSGDKETNRFVGMYHV